MADYSRKSRVGRESRMTAPLRALIVDDEPVGRQCIRLLLDRDDDVTVVGEAADGSTALTALAELAPDLLFLDVQMPGMSGFDVLERLPARRPVVIFSTAYDEYALRAFEAHAIDYLLKPFTNGRFRDALAHAKAIARLTLTDESRDTGSTRPRYLEHIAVRTSVGVTLIPVAQVDWIEAAADYVRIHTEARTFLLRSPIGQLEARLDPSAFVRVHRATIVNLAKMTELKALNGEAFVALLPHGVRRRVSRQGRAQLEKVLGQRL